MAASSPLPLSSEAEERGEIPGDVLSQGSSFLATAGLICETRFGVVKMVEHGFNRRKQREQRSKIIDGKIMRGKNLTEGNEDNEEVIYD